MATGSGLAFWLDYVESRGGLWESAGDSTMVMIPPQLQRRFELPEEFAVTEHPDVAREDGVALLAAGHPLLAAAAEDVLAADDAGLLTLATPASQPPDGERLLAKARDQFPVSHGRIDGSGPVERRLRQVLRVGALVTYTASAEEVFHERAECWLDVPSRQELPEQSVKELRRFIAGGSVPATTPALAAVPPALARAHDLFNNKFNERCRVISGGSARDAAQAELTRAKKYYAEALASLAKRQASAAPDRQALLAARADAVRAEEQRRLAEIEEKHTARYDIRPYRLHLLLVPVLRLPVDVLRGSRRFPMVLDWMLPAAAFAPVSCPACGADTSRWPLAATKTGLACANCLPVPAVEPATPPESGVTGGLATVRNQESSSRSPKQSRAETPAPAASETQSRAKAAPPSRPTARPVPPAAKKKRLSAQAVSAAGEKLAMELWSLTAQENLRALRRLCAEDSPAAAAVRLYGAAGPAVAAGLAPREALQSLTMTSESHGDGELAGTWGYLQTGRADYTYLLRWHAGTRLIAEILPFGNWVTARLPSPRWLFTPAAARMFGGLPEPDIDLDPVAVRLWRKALPVHGVPLTLRCLAAWWRIGDGPGLLAVHRPSVLAAAIHRMVGYRAAETGTTHDAIADVYKVASADTRAVTPLLQTRLKLTPQQPW
ncbi:MAG TPA: hypothetical protein VKS82_07165 [Streptosporangiaceae bacterium]|nr:hypothetical protein [Streptosporangiaceae bacterium]